MPQDLAGVSSIAFDPETPGLVYLTTDGTGVYRSTDGGTSWNRIDDLQQTEMEYASEGLTIATHPQPTLLVETNNHSYRSLDGGATWERKNPPSPGVNSNMFVDRDSTRLYSATWYGLFFSSNAGDTWERAAGALERLQIMALGYADANGHTILYAATSGGGAGTTSSTAAATPRNALTTASTIRYAATAGGAAGTTSSMAAATPLKALTTTSGLVDAGIYRYALLPAPAVTSFIPTSGPVGTSVTLTGTGFTGASKVAFHGTAATSFSVASATKITAAVPSGASTGTIAVTTAGGTGTSATSFTVSIPIPPQTPQTTKKPPQTKITKAKINSRKRMAVFGFRGSGGVKPYKFQCKLDKKKYSSCRSGKTYKHLKAGKHTFRVRAKDDAGRIDKTPAIKKFKIKH